MMYIPGFPICKVVLTLTNYFILALLILLMIKHYNSSYNFNSFSNAFHMLSFIWLFIRGCFWTLTIVSKKSWGAFTFYTLYWMPSPFQFSSFMLLPLFCAQILYPKQWKNYWESIRVVYCALNVAIVLFQIVWSLLAAYESRMNAFECNDNLKPDDIQNARCLHTEYSSDVFRLITAACFLTLATIQGIYGYKFSLLDKKIHDRFMIASSPKYLLAVNSILSLSFLSKGLYQLGAIFYDYMLPDIPLQGDADVPITILLFFELWDYVPTMLLILNLTSISVGSNSIARKAVITTSDRGNRLRSNSTTSLKSSAPANSDIYSTYGSIYKELDNADEEEPTLSASAASSISSSIDHMSSMFSDNTTSASGGKYKLINASESGILARCVFYIHTLTSNTFDTVFDSMMIKTIFHRSDIIFNGNKLKINMAYV